MDYEERRALGRKIRQEVLGASYVGSPGAAPSKFAAAFREFTEEHCWSNVWVRPGLERKTRSMAVSANRVGSHFVLVRQ